MMHAATLHRMSAEISEDPIHRSNVAVPNNAWGFAGYVLAKFGPWGAILIILAIVMFFVNTVYSDGKARNDQLIAIVQQQSDTAVKQAVAVEKQASTTAEQTRSISLLTSATEGLKFSVDQMSRDLQDIKQ